MPLLEKKLRDISKSNGLRQESSCQSDGGDKEKGTVNKMQTVEAAWRRSGSGRQAGMGLACLPPSQGPGCRTAGRGVPGVAARLGGPGLWTLNSLPC